jgi:hypothetical protein
VPLQGTFTGDPGDFVDMRVNVAVTRRPDDPPARSIGRA